MLSSNEKPYEEQENQQITLTAKPLRARVKNTLNKVGKAKHILSQW